MAKQPPNYEKLKKIWYEKLKKSGFNDIEIGKGVISNSDAFSKNQDHGQHTDTWRRSKEEYYQMAEYFLNNYKFETKLDQAIWEYHVNGIGTLDIAMVINKVKSYRRTFSQQEIWMIVSRLRKIMVIGAYEEVE